MAQVGHGQHLFTYDHVFGASAGAEPLDNLYERCVAPLLDGLFRGYNATVFAYGQTGSGKTYTMGSAFSPGCEPSGVIPHVMDAIFSRITRAPRDVDFTVRVGFVEIHKVQLLSAGSRHIWGVWHCVRAAAGRWPAASTCKAVPWACHGLVGNRMHAGCSTFMNAKDMHANRLLQRVLHWLHAALCGCARVSTRCCHVAHCMQCHAAA